MIDASNYDDVTSRVVRADGKGGLGHPQIDLLEKIAKNSEGKDLVPENAADE
ncbi:hypothetical protein FACS189449_03660 [Alphaproteobacteria bacterium]|nr:hypothetical protein FACS189449_03660 [Alphaproteobacteria bacterium]